MIASLFTYSVKTDEGWEIGGLEGMYDLDELGAINGIDGSENTARKNKQLEESSDSFIFGQLGGTG